MAPETATEDTFTGTLDLDGDEAIAEAARAAGEAAEAADLGTAEPEPAAEPGKAPDKPVAVEPAAGKGGNLAVALRRARERAKEASGRLTAIEATRAEEVNNRLAPRAAKIEVKLEVKPERLKALKDKAKDLDTFDQVADLVYNEALKDAAATTQTAIDQVQAATQSQVYDVQVQRLEDRERSRLAHETGDFDHYDKVVSASGLDVDLQVDPATGRVRNQGLAKEVFSKPNPAQALYNLALAKLEEQGKLEQFFPAEAAVPAPAAAPGKPAARREPDRVPAAPRRSIATLPSAGTPETVSGRPFSRPQLDWMAENRPVAYQRIMDKNPEYRKWYLHGSE